MATELMLVRHGKAEERSANKEDAKRQLTEEGKDEFAAFITSVEKDLKTDLNIRVWTSPMKRAKQTAEILSEQLNWPKAEEKEFLASGDYQAFTEEVKALDSDTRVVCVGHKPTQGDWVGVLTGSPYSFKKGGVALIHLGDDRIQGKLVWDNDPKSKKKTDKRVKPIKTVLLNQVDEMEQAYLDFQNNPYAPERTHEFRKTMRKLRSQLHFIKPLIGKEAYKDLNAVIKDAYHRVEPIREADVLITSCGTCALQEPDMIDDFADLFRYLHKERRKWMRTRLTQSMTAAFEDMIKDTRSSIDQLSFKLYKTDDGDIEAYLKDRFKSRRKKVLKTYEQADHSVHKEAHEARKQAKKMKYAVKGYKALLPKKKAKKTKKKLQAIQKELGKVCDLHTNSEWLSDYSEKAEKDSLKDAFSTLADRQLRVRERVIKEDELLHESRV